MNDKLMQTSNMIIAFPKVFTIGEKVWTQPNQDLIKIPEVFHLTNKRSK